jgi:hypothetical protein
VWRSIRKAKTQTDLGPLEVAHFRMILMYVVLFS